MKFLEKANNKFGNKFDYSKVNYINCNTPITIICSKHGEFETTPTKFLVSKHGCPKCAHESTGKSRKLTTEEFIHRSKELYESKYTYEKVNYINSDTKVLVTCRVHGDFLTRPSDFLRGHGCPKCKGEVISQCNYQKRSTLEEFVAKGQLLYGNLFSYDNVIYVNGRTKVLIHSNLLNEDFLITPIKFINGDIKKKYLGLDFKSTNLTSEIFIQRGRLIHGNKYDYSKVEYKNLTTKVELICPRHGSFLQCPNDHLNRNGCPKCNQSKGEKVVESVLKLLNLNFNSQYTISFNNRKYKIDFCIFFNNKTIFIEYNGIQHYKPVEIFGGEEKFKLQIVRDNELREYCKKNDIILFEYKYDIPLEKLGSIIKEDLNKL